MSSQRMLVMLAALSAVPHAAQGAGFQAYFEQSAAALGQAAAVVARADEPGALFFNPAAAVSLSGTQFAATLNGLMQDTRYVPDSQAAAGGISAATLSGQPIAVPSGCASRRLGNRWAVGLGINTPYGSATDWSADWGGRYYADQTCLRSAYLAPTVAYAAGSRIALGAALMAVWGEAVVERAINAPLVFASAAPDLAAAYMSGAFTPANDVQTHLSGDDWGWGARLGVQAQLTDRWRAGIAYQTAVELDLSGRATYAKPTYADADFAHQPGSGATANQLAAVLFPDTQIRTQLRLPPTFSAGVALRAAPQFVLEADLMWTGWSSYDSLAVDYASLGGGSDVRAGTPKLWEDTFTFRLGAEYALTDRLSYRAGYAYDQSPVPDETRDPSLPGSDRHDLTVGLGYRTAGWSFDVGYLYAMLTDSPSEQESALNGNLAGSYEGQAHVVACGFTLRVD